MVSLVFVFFLPGVEWGVESGGFGRRVGEAAMAEKEEIPGSAPEGRVSEDSSGAEVEPEVEPAGGAPPPRLRKRTLALLVLFLAALAAALGGAFTDFPYLTPLSILLMLALLYLLSRGSPSGPEGETGA